MPSLQEIYDVLANRVSGRYPEVARRHGIPAFLREFERLLAESARPGGPSPTFEADAAALRGRATRILRALAADPDPGCAALVREYLGLGEGAGGEGGPGSGWALWYVDTFEPGPATREHTGSDLATGLRVLWEHTLLEAVQDDGRATFSRFRLTWRQAAAIGDEGIHPIEVPVDPFDNPGLAKLRGWCAPGGPTGREVLDRIAALHFELLQRSGRWLGGGVRPTAEAERLLALAARAGHPAELSRFTEL